MPHVKSDDQRKPTALDTRKVFRLFDRPVQPVTDQSN